MNYKIKNLITRRLKSIKPLVKEFSAWIPIRYKFSKYFWENYYFLKECEIWPEEQIYNWQNSKVIDTIKNAYDNVPYYNRLYNKAGININEIKSVNDIKYLPFVSKIDIKDNLNDFISTEYNINNLMVAFTGGSTSSPMKFYIDYIQQEKELSYFYYIWEKMGYKIGDRCVSIKGEKIADVRNNRFSKYNRGYNWLCFDSDYLNKIEYCKYYVNEIIKFNADVLFGYPSSIYQLAKTILNCNIKSPHFKIILLASENTYSEQNEFIKDVFSADTLFFHYGHSEQVLLAFKCFNSNILHFLPQYGHVEIIDKNNENIIDSEDQFGEIVGTNYSKAMPFIRYRTNDFAKTTRMKCNQFPSHVTIKNIDGRLQEYIVTEDNRLVSLCSMAGAHFKSLEKVMDNQYFQKEPGKIDFRIVENPLSPISDEDVTNIKNELERKLEYKVHVNIVMVEVINRLASNKKSMIEQHLDISQFI